MDMSTKTPLKNNRIVRWTTKILLDLLAVAFCSVIAVVIADLTPPLFDASLPVWLIFHMVVTLAIFIPGGVYRITYRYFGMADLFRLVIVDAVILAIEIVFDVLYKQVTVAGVAVYILLFVITTVGIRVAIRTLVALESRTRRSGDKKRVIIVGAGDAGSAIIRELQSTDKLSLLPVAVLDDDPVKQGHSVCGVRVVGTTDDVAATVARYRATHIIVAMPSMPKKTVSRIYQKCQVPGVKVQTLPGLYQLASGQVSYSQIRDVEVQDLLGREQIVVDMQEIMSYIEDRTVLVTGGGGSIGSELCRQIASHSPKKLIIFDIYENNAYEIEQELKRTYPDLNLLVLIGSIRDMGRLENLFATHRPQIVFNAAAHKHVPLMETSPNEAVKNNVFGTYNVARCADKYGVLRFVQISTDKAVNPTNIMGATKRICEMIIQAIGRHSSTEFVAVRFGNVLGSNGSVIPLFKKQIATGGPVTVTHKDIIRYFMTIPEAVSLVLQAGAYAKGGEIYVLDMGEQVRIYDLAENLIRLSGYEPGVDIEIQITGLRPGEKLYEERLMDEEGMQKTENAMISIGKPLDIDEEALFKKLDELYEAAYSETDRMKELVHELVPTYIIDKSGKGNPVAVG